MSKGLCGGTCKSPKLHHANIWDVGIKKLTPMYLPHVLVTSKGFVEGPNISCVNGIPWFSCPLQSSQASLNLLIEFLTGIFKTVGPSRRKTIERKFICFAQFRFLLHDSLLARDKWLDWLRQWYSSICLGCLWARRNLLPARPRYSASNDRKLLVLSTICFCAWLHHGCVAVINSASFRRTIRDGWFCHGFWHATTTRHTLPHIHYITIEPQSDCEFVETNYDNLVYPKSISKCWENMVLLVGGAVM